MVQVELFTVFVASLDCRQILEDKKAQLKKILVNDLAEIMENLDKSVGGWAKRNSLLLEFAAQLYGGYEEGTIEVKERHIIVKGWVRGQDGKTTSKRMCQIDFADLALILERVEAVKKGHEWSTLFRDLDEFEAYKNKVNGEKGVDNNKILSLIY